MPDINELIENANKEIEKLIAAKETGKHLPLATGQGFSHKTFRLLNFSEFEERIFFYQAKLEAYLEVKEWLGAWMSTGEVNPERPLPDCAHCDSNKDVETMPAYKCRKCGREFYD